MLPTLGRWKSRAKAEMGDDCCNCPKLESAQEMRSFLCCPRKGTCSKCTTTERCCESESCNLYYRPECASGACAQCADNWKKLTCNKCEKAVPNITHQKWTDGTYKRKDGTEKKTWDFERAESAISDFMVSLSEYSNEFIPHHNRAKFLDHDWKKLWDNVSDNGRRNDRIAVVMDYANSYCHEHRDEHYQEFWNQLSTTILGCVIKIPVACLTDECLKRNGYGRESLLSILKVNHHPNPNPTPNSNPSPNPNPGTNPTLTLTLTPTLI